MAQRRTTCPAGAGENYRDQHKILLESTQRLNEYIEQEQYRGYDPYDALKSPLFRLPYLNRNKFIRFSTQQLIKRSPINLRPVLGVPKGYNPVTLGLCIQGYSYLTKAFNAPERTNYRLPVIDYQNRIINLVHELKNLISPGFHGACWGYDFPWEARYASIGAYQPTVVATGIIINALYEAFKIAGINECADLIKSSAHFVLNDLNRTQHKVPFIFSYSPFDKQKVFNASMKGVRILAQAYLLTRDESLKNVAKKAVEFVISHQKKDGSWEYSLSEKGGWTDNYHSGYVLECLNDYSNLCNDSDYYEYIRNGFSFYRNKFIREDGMPGFYENEFYPADSTAAAQTILTLVKFADIETATKVALWMIDHMQAEEGYFYYRKYKNHTVRTSFMRWSNAWMFAALACLLGNQ